jgi:hypothetical protein
VDRETLNNLIYIYNIDYIIFDQRLINAFNYTYSESSDSSLGTKTIYTPNSTSSDISLPLSRVTYLDLVNSKLEEQVTPTNVYCRDCTKTFASMKSLKQHQHSAAYASSMFHFPIALLDGKHTSGPTRSFTTLSGLTQYLKAKACVGGATTEKCKSSFTNLYSFILSGPHRQDASLRNGYI